MNAIIEAIRTRRAQKSFDPSYTISDEELTSILDTTRYAPTAFNLQNYRFLVVRDAEQRRKIKEVAWNQPQIEECAALIIICADTQAWQKDPARYWKDTPEQVQELYTGMIRQYYEGKPQVQRDEAFRSSGIAAYALMMAAAAHGLQTCPMDGFDFGSVAEIIRLPKDYELVMFVALGKGLEAPKGRGGFLPLEEIVAHDTF
ncbi:NADH/NADPH-flavin oxidoreductase [Neokomagataea thailandica NBRC 106555]|uniref:Nitroreductase family protein n=2 Tax=Neokomagataea TaxID=1223423 RepID=A0A4Y6V5J3_9PROT|nr:MULTISPECIES: nitroreductase family protein [Neokomagataea]QDH25382.1 nitroreductase family protein [Neokomagataea tanensis]GBR54672.1 NADH/NADPH-flavin oxidoreductase [Neokomagataea thailandica NBRC 106555]